ncbi:hypothetical protein KBD33_05985 [Candidatus Gracilibacteria bacterium]|nr:hypothetical protein [Candidatus Gracilibacteria bacterium]
MKSTTKPCRHCGKDMPKGLANVCSFKCNEKYILQKEKEKKKALKEKKKVSPRKLYKENVEMAKKIAKIRDNYTCQWCGSTENIHGSHIINEARDHRLATYEFNIKALCFHCHMNLWHKEPNMASEWFNKKFPGRYQLLNELHIEYGKDGKITPDWHREENIRLKTLLKQHENS